MKYLGIVLALLLLTACETSPYSDDPAIANTQRWTDICRGYSEVLGGLADGLELGYISPTDQIWALFNPVRTVLRPICTNPSELPSEPVPGGLQDKLDRILFDLIKARREAENSV